MRLMWVANIELADYISAKSGTQTDNLGGAQSPDTASASALSPAHGMNGLRTCKGSGGQTKVASRGGLLSDNLQSRQGVLRKAFWKTNDDIQHRSFNISFSGSTAVTVLLIGNKLVCANVGDSRAILASYKNPKSIQNIQLPPEFADLGDNEKIWLALPLSRDHKPDDEEEYKRIIDSNGRVEPFKEPTGESVGPYRVWLKEENIPGLAMSRSLGDKVASSVGVISEPEMYETVLSVDDKFIVIASDGIWEFLPNDQVVEMIVPYWQDNNPEGACERLVNEAVYHWQNEDEVIDDITIIIIFLSAP
jgi:serine/threonine protein phosphatase PrpC